MYYDQIVTDVLEDQDLMVKNALLEDPGYI